MLVNRDGSKDRTLNKFCFKLWLIAHKKYMWKLIYYKWVLLIQWVTHQCVRGSWGKMLPIQAAL